MSVVNCSIQITNTFGTPNLLFWENSPLYSTTQSFIPSRRCRDACAYLSRHIPSCTTKCDPSKRQSPGPDSSVARGKDRHTVVSFSVRQRQRHKCVEIVYVWVCVCFLLFSRPSYILVWSFNSCHPTQTVAPGNFACAFCLCRHVSSRRRRSRFALCCV